MKCPICDTNFTPKRKDALTCSPKCRKKYSRNVTKAEDIVTDKNISVTNVTDKPKSVTDNVTDNFVPNWKNKFSSKEHAIEGMLKALEVNRAAILKHGVNPEITFHLGDKIFTLTKKGFLKK